MNWNADEPFDTQLRRGLRAGPPPVPIRDLPDRAIALAVSRRLTSTLGAEGRFVPTTPRLLGLSTMLALLAIVGIIVVGGWSLLHTELLYSAWNAGASESLNTGQFDDTGFAVAILAVVVLFIATLMRSIMDAIGIEGHDGDALLQLSLRGVDGTKGASHCRL